MSGQVPRRNRRYRPKAREALYAAKAAFRTAKSAARRRDVRQAVASLVDAGEEVAKAILYNAAYDDLLTFDYRRAGETVFLLSEDRLMKEHEPKQGSLIGVALAFVIVHAALKVKELTPDEKHAISKNPEPWMMREFPNLATFLELAPRLEELRQSRYSGTPKTGRRGRQVSLRELRRIGAVIGQLIDFSHYELNVFRWKKGELAEIQAAMPAYVRKVNPLIELARRGAGKGERLGGAVPKNATTTPTSQSPR